MSDEPSFRALVGVDDGATKTRARAVTLDGDGLGARALADRSC